MQPHRMKSAQQVCLQRIAKVPFSPSKRADFAAQNLLFQHAKQYVSVSKAYVCKGNQLYFNKQTKASLNEKYSEKTTALASLQLQTYANSG